MNCYKYLKKILILFFYLRFEESIILFSVNFYAKKIDFIIVSRNKINSEYKDSIIFHQKFHFNFKKIIQENKTSSIYFTFVL